MEYFHTYKIRNNYAGKILDHWSQCDGHTKRKGKKMKFEQEISGEDF